MVGKDPGFLSGHEEPSSGIKPVPYHRRNMWKAEIRPENGWIKKNYGDAPLPSRIFGRVFLRWEESALKMLKGIEGTPLFLGRPTRYSIKMSRLPGIPLDKLKRGELSEACFRRLQSLVHQMHSKGVAHGDLHMRNILICVDKPFIIDFSTAYVRGRLPVLDKNFFKLFVLLDLERLYKIEKEFFGKGTPPRMFYLYRLVKAIR